jgi:hypothetical protein
MPALLSQPECQSLHAHIQTSPLALENLHTRNYRVQKQKRVLRHLNAMKLVNATIHGFACGPGLSIEYEIDNTGQVSVNASTLSIRETLAYLNRYIKREILQRVAQGHAAHRTRLTVGHYYLRRSKAPRVTKAASKAVTAGLLTQNFVTTICRWNLKVIVGGGA